MFFVHGLELLDFLVTSIGVTPAVKNDVYTMQSLNISQRFSIHFSSQPDLQQCMRIAFFLKLLLNVRQTLLGILDVTLNLDIVFLQRGILHKANIKKQTALALVLVSYSIECCTIR